MLEVFHMDEKSVLNHVLVELFNEILKTEENCISKINNASISMTEIHVIEAVCNSEEADMDNRASSIASALKITPGSLTTSVSILEKKGYLVREKDDKDKRIVRISSTPKGREINKIHKAFHDEMVQETLSILEPNEITIFIKALEKISVFFENKYKE